MLKLWWLVMMTAVLAACSKPLPADKQAYAGDWRGDNMTLRIQPDGLISYERIEGNTTTKINAPIQSFDGDHFSVGYGPITTTFEVSQPPHQIDGVWFMTVDGVELNAFSHSY